MKQFFEQYGAVALGILALIVLIAMITPVGNIIKTSLQGTVQTFSTKMNGQADTMSSSLDSIMESTTNGFNGLKGGKFYQHDFPVSLLEDKTLNEDGTLFVDGSGRTYQIYIDVDMIVDDRIYVGGYPETKFDVYKNEALYKTGVSDLFEAISLNNNDKYKLVIIDCPDEIEIENPVIEINLYEMSIVSQGSGTRYDFEAQFKGHTK